ncbi:hypothetical protein CKG00_03130, partial [Morganella morganii]
MSIYIRNTTERYIMADIKDVKLSDLNNMYKTISSLDQKYVPYNFKKAYEDRLLFIERIQKINDRGYVFHLSQLNKIDDNILHDIIYHNKYDDDTTKKYIIAILQQSQ